MEIESHRRYRLPAAPDVVWTALANTDDYRHWWPWLTTFEGGGLDAGRSWRCTVRPPLPYTLRFEIHLDEVAPPTFVTARVTGDIAGRARLDLAADGDGCEVSLTSALAPDKRAFAVIARLAGPVVRRAHDWVLDTGAHQFRQVIDRR